MELDQYITKWSERLSISEDEIRKEYNGILEQEKLLHSEMSEEDRKARTLQRLAMTYKKQLRSPAVGFEGMIIALGDAIDTVARIRAEAIKQFKENRQQAIAVGITDGEGTPLDTRAEWANGQPNRGFAKPLPEHNFLRTVFGVVKKKNVEEDAKFFTLNLSGEVAKDDDIPIFKPISFRAIDKTEPAERETLYKLNSSVFTEFNVDESLKVPAGFDLISNYCGHIKQKLADLDAYHIINEKDYNRLIIVEGDVTTMVLEPTSVGSRRLVIDDEQGEIDIESPGTTCWVPERIDIDFAEQSRVIVLGRTTRGKKLDENGQQTDEPGDVMINVYGLYVIPEYKITPNIKELTKENTEVKEESPEETKPGPSSDDW